MPTSFVVHVASRAGLVGSDGKVYVPAAISRILEPSEGTIAYYNGSAWGMATEAGNVSCAPKFQDLKPLRGGRTAFRGAGSSAWGLCDAKGTVLVEPRFDEILLAPGPLWAREGKRWGLVGDDGAWVVEPAFDDAFAPGGGLWPARRGGLYGAIDATGAEVLPFRYACLTTPDEAVAPAKEGAGWGFVDRAGEWRVAPEHAAARCLGEGMLAVTRGAWNGPSALVGPDGARLTDFVYTRLARFQEGLCAFERDGRWGWLDHEGKEQVPARFFEATDFRDGRAHVGGGRIVDTRGEVVAVADAAKLAPTAPPLTIALLRQDIGALRSLAASGAPIAPSDSDAPPGKLSLGRQLRLLVLEETTYAPDAVLLSIRAAQCYVSDAPEIPTTLWARWAAEGHGDALRDAIVAELAKLPADAGGASSRLIRALADLPGLDVEPVAAALLDRLPVEAASGSVGHLQGLIERISLARSPAHLRTTVRAAIANGDVARDPQLVNDLRAVKQGPLACELLDEVLAAISPDAVAALRASGGDPASRLGLLTVVGALLEHAATQDTAPARPLAEHEDWAVATALGLVDPYAHEPLGWVEASPALLAWARSVGPHTGAVLDRHGLSGAPASLGLPASLPRGLEEALVFVDGLGLAAADLERKPGVDAEHLARITARLGGAIPAELSTLLTRHGGFGEAISPTLMDLDEGGSPERLPLGADGTGELYLLAPDGRVWHGGEVVAPTLGWLLARVAVEAWGRKHAEVGRTSAYLRERLAEALAGG